ncbi:BnaA01g26620D [Brassica napus]|uniref:BnaA01g26620D protein n=2 Tax=Brassica TaxID=3705 RepID=A0A078G1R9_BRANA|nr:BnaA01g26620D [Brassica napus]
MNVEDYSGSLRAQGPNGLQNMDLQGYNNNSINTNGFSHQLVQFPAQRAAPACQYVDGSTQNIRPQFQYSSFVG